MDWAHAALIAVAGLVAGGVNTIAGGGTLISFPALLGAGVPAVTANITSSVGLVSGYAGGTQAYRRELVGQGYRLRALGAVSVAGGVVGALVLLLTPAESFRMVAPYLVLVSSLLLAVQPRLAVVVARRQAERADGDTREITPLLHAGVFVAGVYGSYFGAGLGVLLLGVLGVLLRDELQRLNALKSALSLLVKLVGVVIFLASARVHWSYAAILLVTAYAGGFLGGKVARRLRPDILRYAVVVLGVTVAVIMIIKG